MKTLIKVFLVANVLLFANASYMYRSKFMTSTAPLGDHCEQQPTEDTFVLSTQELQSPPGPAHSDGIVYTQGSFENATSVGLIYFSNNIVFPDDNSTSMGKVSRLHPHKHLHCCAMY